MAIYGIGAYYDRDVSDLFLNGNLVGVGWDKGSAPELHEYIRSLKVGDIVYIKAAFGGADISVKGVGIVRDTRLLNSRTSQQTVEIGRNVLWVSKKKFVILRPDEKNNVRSNTVYEEFHPKVQKRILAELRSIVLSK